MAVEGDRQFRARREARPGARSVAPRREGAAFPIGGACPSDDRAAVLPDLREMTLRRGGVVQPAQGDEAGEELAFVARFPGRGLAVRVNPENGILLALVGFAPTTADDYARRLRPVPEVARPVQTGRWRP